MTREILNKPNQLIGIKAEKRITTTQRKAYNVLLKVAQKEIKFSKLSEIEISKDRLYWFEVDVNTVHGVAGVNNKNLDYIYEELKRLMGIIVTVREEDNPDNWEAFSILPKIRKENNVYQFALFGNLTEALKKQDYFTTLDLLMIQSLSSQYAVIFYELAVRYQKYKIPKMSIAEVREITNTQNKYSRFEAFRRRVLDITCEEISEKTDIILTYKTEKKGKRIAFIDFEIKRKYKDIVEIETKEIKEIKEYSEQVLELFELLPDEEQVKSNKEILSKLLNKYDFELIKSDIIYAKKQDTQKFMAYLSKSCQSGHYSKVELEKQQRKKEVQQKAKTYRQEQQIILQKIKLEAWELAKEKYLELGDEEKKNYLKGYELLLPMFKSTKEDYIISAIQTEIEESLKQEQGIYWVEEKKD
jgi:plasmid replication initiation protein